MLINDSRMPRGIGILPLQHSKHKEGGWSTDMRASVLAVRITGRNDKEDGLGHWYYDKDSAGDLTNTLCWPNAGRSVPGWAWAWASVIGAGGGTATRSARRGAPGGSTMAASPMGDRDGSPDGRFKPLPVPPLKLMANFQEAGPQGGPPKPQGNGNQGFDVFGDGGGVLQLGIGARPLRGVGSGSGFSRFSFNGNSSEAALSGIPGVGRGSGFSRFSRPVEPK